MDIPILPAALTFIIIGFGGAGLSLIRFKRGGILLQVATTFFLLNALFAVAALITSENFYINLCLYCVLAAITLTAVSHAYNAYFRPLIKGYRIPIKKLKELEKDYGAQGFEVTESFSEVMNVKLKRALYWGFIKEKIRKTEEKDEPTIESKHKIVIEVNKHRCDAELRFGEYVAQIQNKEYEKRWEARDNWHGIQVSKNKPKMCLKRVYLILKDPRSTRLPVLGSDKSVTFKHSSDVLYIQYTTTSICRENKKERNQTLSL